MKCAAATLSRLAYRWRPTQQLRQLGKFTVIRRTSSRVSRFGRRAMRRSEMSEIGGEAECTAALETTLMDPEATSRLIVPRLIPPVRGETRYPVGSKALPEDARMRKLLI